MICSTRLCYLNSSQLVFELTALAAGCMDLGLGLASSFLPIGDNTLVLSINIWGLLFTT